MIVFDFDRVLSDSQYWYEDVCERIRAAHAVEHDALLTWMIEHGNRSWIPGEWNDETFLSRLNDAFSIEATMKDIEAGCEASMRYDENVMRLIKQLGSIVVFTDNPAVRVRVIERTLPVPSHITFSQALGVQKRNGFDRFIEASGIDRGLLIDDIEVNVEAARRAGFEGLVWKIGDPIDILERAIDESGYKRSP